MEQEIVLELFDRYADMVYRIAHGSYETAYYYTSADGYEFLIKMHNGRVWVECNTSHAGIDLYGAYLSADEVEDILDNLSLTINK